MRHRMIGAAAALALALGGSQAVALAQNGPAGAQANRNMGLSKQDRSFVKFAAQSGMAEVREGELAKQRAINTEETAFADRLVTDHTHANDQLKDIAGREGIPLPGTIGAANERELSSLDALRGAAFARTLASANVKDHEHAIAVFEREARDGRDPALRQFAQQTIPTLQEHLHMAQELQSRMAALHRSRP